MSRWVGDGAEFFDCGVRNSLRFVGWRRMLYAVGGSFSTSGDGMVDSRGGRENDGRGMLEMRDRRVQERGCGMVVVF